jgi:polar amino acid transport system substrate-binding protein
VLLRIAPLLFAAAIAGLAQAARAEDLVVYFHERPPYSWQEADGRVRGLVAEPTEKALVQAGIPFRWEKLPSARQAEVFKADALAACGIGWFKRPEREAYARFSQPVYRDGSLVAIARRDDGRFGSETRLAALLARRDVKLLVKNGYSYGSYVDAEIGRLQSRSIKTSTDNHHMMQMIALQRADYMLMSREEADHLLSQNDAALATLGAYPLADAPAGEARHLMCARKVPQKLIEDFNAALAGR